MLFAALDYSDLAYCLSRGIPFARCWKTRARSIEKTPYGENISARAQADGTIRKSRKMIFAHVFVYFKSVGGRGEEREDKERREKRARARAMLWLNEKLSSARVPRARGRRPQSPR